MPEADDTIYEYLDNENVKILHVLYDEYQPYSCAQWANEGNYSEIPLIVKESNSSTYGDVPELLDRFFEYEGMPLYLFLDHEMNVYYKYNPFNFDGNIKLSESQVKEYIDEMLENIGEK